MNTEFRIFIRNLRENLTQNQMAEKLKVSLSTVKNWERGQTTPDNYGRKQICEVFKISEKELLESINTEKNCNFKMINSTRTEKIKKAYEELFVECSGSEISFRDFFEYEGLDYFYLSKLEKELFFILDIASECGGDATLAMLRKNNNPQIIRTFLKKLRVLGLYETNWYEDKKINYITTKGNLILKIIETSENEEFNFLELNIDKGITFFVNSFYFSEYERNSDLHKILLKMEELVYLIKEIDEANNGFYLNQYIKEGNEYIENEIKYEYNHRYYDINPSIRFNPNRTYRMVIDQYLDLNYYEIIQEDMDGLNLEKVVLTSKGKKILELTK